MRHFRLLPVLLLAACAAAPLAPSKGDLSAPPEPKILTVAVLEFEDHGIAQTVATQGLGRTLSDRIAEQLAGRPDLRLIDRESLQKILEELSLATLDLADREGQLRLGKLLGAQYLVMGGYSSLGGALRIDGRIVEVEKGLTEGSALEGPIAERRAIEKRFSTEIADLLVAKAGLPTGTPKTARDYFMRGVSLEQSNHPQKALEMYQKALAIDPKDAEARERMENLLLKEIQ